MALVWLAAVWSLLSIVTAVLVCAVLRGGGLGAVTYEPASAHDG